MSSKNSPGISFKDILLVSSEFRSLNAAEAKLAYKLELTQLTREISETEKGSELYCLFGFDLMHGIEEPACILQCTYAARYARKESSAMTWDEFTDGMAVSHVVAYVREFAMNLTARSGLPRLYLNPINANGLVSRFHKRNEEE